MLQAVQGACADAGVNSTQIDSLFLGMAGVVTEEDRAQALAQCRRWPLNPACHGEVDHDIRIALHGGLSGRPGIALIAGTGSSCYGRNAVGDSWQAGGWDRYLDDLGSGYDLAQKGMATACQSADGRLVYSTLQELLFGALGAATVADFALKVHRPGLARHKVAALAPLVLQAAQQGDAAAVRIVDQGADELSRMVEAVATRLFPDLNPEVVLIGSLLEKSAEYRRHVEAAIRARLPQACVRPAELRPAIGALSLAAEAVQASIPLATLKQVSTQARE